MKLNKKVFAGALALAMGLGVVAPAVESLAAKAGSTMEIVEKEYKAKGEAWLKAYNNLEAAKEVEKDLNAKIDAAKKAVQEATNKEVDANKLDSKKEDDAVKEAQQNKDKAEEAYNTENGKEDKDEYKVNKFKKDLEEAEAKLKEAKKAQKAKKEENKKAQDAAKEATKKAKEDLEKAENAKRDKKIKVEAEELALHDAIEKLTQNEKQARDDFKAEGANNAIIDVMKKLNDVVLPNDKKVEEADKESKRAEIEKLLASNKKKVAALEAVKELMKETYKKHKKIVDEALAKAQKAIEAAEKYLAPKTASLFTVAYASSEEDVLKGLQDAEKSLDEAINAVENDSKESNEKENKENKENKDNKDNKENKDNKDNAPKVEKKEMDKKASNNVKTGIAGVAGVAAVLAAASAAYVSSKRN